MQRLNPQSNRRTSFTAQSSTAVSYNPFSASSSDSHQISASPLQQVPCPKAPSTSVIHPTHSSSSSSLAKLQPNYYSSSAQSDNCAKQRMGYQARSDSDQRSALFSGFKRQTASTVGKASSDNEADRHAAQLTSDLEAQNDEMLNEMHNKVLGLKEIAQGMREQVRESNSLLDKMGTAMTAAGGLLSNTMTRLQALTSYRTGRHIWFMMLFFVLALFVMYLLFSKRR